MADRKAKKSKSKNWFIDSSESEGEVNTKPVSAQPLPAKGRKRARPIASRVDVEHATAPESSISTEATSTEPSEKYECAMCGSDITSFSLIERENHVNACIDRTSRDAAPNPGPLIPPDPQDSLFVAPPAPKVVIHRKRKATPSNALDQEQLDLAVALSLSVSHDTAPSAGILRELAAVEGKMAALKKQKQRLQKQLKNLSKQPVTLQQQQQWSLQDVTAETALSLVFSPTKQRKSNDAQTSKSEGMEGIRTTTTTTTTTASSSLWALASLDDACSSDLCSDLLTRLVQEFRYEKPPPLNHQSTTNFAVDSSSFLEAEATTTATAIVDETMQREDNNGSLGVTLTQFLDIIDSNLPAAGLASPGITANSSRTNLVQLWQRRISPEVLEHFPQAAENIEFVFSQDLQALLTAQAQLAKKAKRQLSRLLQQSDNGHGSRANTFLSQFEGQSQQQEGQEQHDTDQVLLGSVYAVVFFLGVLSDGIQLALLTQPSEANLPSSSRRESEDAIVERDNTSPVVEDRYSTPTKDDTKQQQEEITENSSQEDYPDACLIYEPEQITEVATLSNLNSDLPTELTQISSQHDQLPASQQQPEKRSRSRTIKPTKQTTAASKPAGMPNYSAMSEGQLAMALKTYGMKPQPQPKMVQTLENIWMRLHGGSDQVPLSMTAALSGRSPVRRKKTQASSEAPTQPMDLRAALLTYLHSRLDIYEKILLYQPISLDTFVDEFMNSATTTGKFSKKELLAVLDTEDVFVTAFARKQRKKQRG